MQQAVRRFSALALASFAVLVASGGVLWWRVPATVRDLPDSSYGVHLIVKVVLVGGIALVAAWNLRHLRTHRAIDLAARLRRTVSAEVALVAVVYGGDRRPGDPGAPLSRDPPGASRPRADRA